MQFVPKKAANLAIVATSFLLSSLTPVSALAAPSIAREAMPLAFEQNQGQTDSRVKFISRGASGVLYLSADEIALRAKGSSGAFRLKLRGASASASIQGGGQSGGTVNYLRGNRSAKWLTNIPSYTQAEYKGIYPGIDLIVYGNNGQFESDFVVAPNADPSAIAMQLNGTLELRHDGSLAVESAGGAFKLHRPFVYQVAPNGERVAVESRYTVEKNVIGFALGQYDRSKSLVIDPVISYSSYFGGTGGDSILGIRTDASGNIYVTGLTTSVDLPVMGAFKAKQAGDTDCFISKLDPTGQKLIFSTYLGGSAFDRCSAIGVNSSNQPIVAGWTYSTNFPTQNAIQGTLKGTGSNGFVTHLDSTGSKLIFSTYLGGGGEFLADLALDSSSNVYVTGVTNSPNFPTTKGAFQSVYPAGSLTNAFVSKISAPGCRLIYSTFVGGSSYDSGTGIAVDALGYAYITGETTSTDFPVKTPYQAAIAGSNNAYVTKLSSDGSNLIYSTYVGGNGFDSGTSIAVDSSGNTYVTGRTTSTNFPTLNPFQSMNKGGTDAFVFKLNNTGKALVYSSYMGGTQYDYPFHISVDSAGTASVAGETTSNDLQVKAAVQSVFGGGFLDAFVMNVSSAGVLNYLTYLGGTGDDYGFAVYSNPTGGGVWSAGVTYSGDYPVKTPFQANTKGAANGDGFITRINP